MIGRSYNTSRLFVSYAGERASVPQMPVPCVPFLKNRRRGLTK